MVALNRPYSWLLHLALACAACVPVLLAYNLPPSATFFNQASAFFGWGIAVAVVASIARTGPSRPNADVAVALAALLLLAVAAALEPLFVRQPVGMAVATAGTLLGAAIVLLCAATASARGCSPAAYHAFCLALLVAGAASLAIGIVQVFAPQWSGGAVIASSTLPGRSVGNLRQPNHLSSLLLWTAIGVVWLVEAGSLRRTFAIALFTSMVFGVVLTASRTGVAGVLVLALWGMLDRRLATHSRILLCSAPVAYAVGWAGMTLWTRAEHTVFAGQARLSEEGALATSRYDVWGNALELIQRHPWTGVGTGEFNFAWSLTPFEPRSGEFFDHTHNIALQLLVEHGVPLGMLVLGLLVYALWRAFIASREAPGLQGAALRAAFVMLLVMALHSQLEYPLWYAYFLLPTAFLLGLCTGRVPDGEPDAQRSATGARPLAVAGLLMAAAGFLAVLDYRSVVPIFEPPRDAAPLAERIARGQRSLLFAHHADYAAATTARHPSDEIDSIRYASHHLLDARLMMAWAQALHESGDDERARHVAARLREFHSPQSAAFFAPCRKAASAGAAPPFQCVAPTRALDYRDFR